MKSKTLTEDQRTTLTNGLSVAADKFEANAEFLRSVSPASLRCVAETFYKQARESRELVKLLIGYDSITLQVGDPKKDLKDRPEREYMQAIDDFNT